MPKKVDLAAKRAEFVKASIHIIANEGLAAATMRRVATAAGCTTGSLTHYYTNRNGLLLDTLRSVHHSAAARMRPCASQSPNAAERLRQVLAESLPMDTTRYNEWRVWLAFWAASMDDPALTQENTKRYRQWTDLVATLLEPFVPPREVQMSASQLVALVDGLGIGIARERPNSTAIGEQRQICQEVIERHLTICGIPS